MSGSVNEHFLEKKKLVTFEFESTFMQLLPLSRLLWAFVIPHIFAFLLWEQLVDLAGLLFALKSRFCHSFIK